ncbi:MAG: hypothetical protein S4CHLAM20_10670 [Chlamydiia bacterium]|nr:hypothetical protein [Chlamydiia bacterium]
MNIKKYEDYFHDGSIINIENEKHDLIISMSSNSLDPDYIDETLDLDHLNCIRGKLYITNVSKILLYGGEINYPIFQIHDCGGIIDFEIKKNKVILKGEWIDFPPKKQLPSNYFSYEIYAENVSWENMPDLFDPFD